MLIWGGRCSSYSSHPHRTKHVFPAFKGWSRAVAGPMWCGAGIQVPRRQSLVISWGQALLTGGDTLGVSHRGSSTLLTNVMCPQHPPLLALSWLGEGMVVTSLPAKSLGRKCPTAFPSWLPAGLPFCLDSCPLAIPGAITTVSRDLLS